MLLQCGMSLIIEVFVPLFGLCRSKPNVNDLSVKLAIPGDPEKSDPTHSVIEK